MFADDTQLGTATKDVKTTIEILNDDLANISVWMVANKLSLNKSKIEYMLIGSYQKLKQCNSDSQIKIGDTLIQRVTAIKSLGIMIDETLTWHSNTDIITKKVNRGLHVLKRLRDLVDMGTLVTVYKTLIQPHFDYCSQVWGCLGITLQSHLQRLQNRAVSIITKRGYEFRLADILKELDLPTLSIRRYNQLCITMYQVINNMVPDYLADLFTKTSALHNHETRQAEFNLTLPKPNTNFRKKSFSYRGAVTWNDLLPNMKNMGSLSTFKRAIVSNDGNFS